MGRRSTITSKRFNAVRRFRSNLSLFGPALDSPDGVSTSGSTFAFSLFSDPLGTVPVLTSDTVNGFGYVVDVNLDGTTTVTNFLRGSSVAPEPAADFWGCRKLPWGLL